MVRYTLPGISYGYDGLEPFISEQTVRLHHTQHHQSCVDGLNAALARIGGSRHPRYISAILSDMTQVPESERDAVAFFGGGFENHRMLWETMAPRYATVTGGAPAAAAEDSTAAASTADTDPASAGRRAGAAEPGPGGILEDAMRIYFGGFRSFQEMFARQAASVQGSGWCWLVLNPTYNRPEIMATANNDSPWMFRYIPLLGIDLWEHAYYPTYQDERAEYVKAWWHVINWQNVEGRYTAAVE